MTESYPLVSVIIPVYNEEEYIEDAIESLLTQTYPEIELIFIDGCSDDRSLKILKQYAQEYQEIKIIENKTNVGPGFSRNRGLMVAEGEYIAFHDADDISTPDRIAQQVELLEQNPEVGVVGSSYYYINPLRDSRSVRIRPADDREIRSALSKECMIHLGTSMFRAEALYETNLFQANIAEVYEIIIDVAAEWKLANIEKPLYVYRVNEGSISRDGELTQKLVLIQRNLQAISKLDLETWRILLSLGWLVYLYAPNPVKKGIHRLFSATTDKSLSPKQQQALAKLLGEQQ